MSGVAVAAVLLQTGRASLPDTNGKFTKRDATDKIGVGVDGRFVVTFHAQPIIPSDSYSLSVLSNSIPTLKRQ